MHRFLDVLRQALQSSSSTSSTGPMYQQSGAPYDPASGGVGSGWQAAAAANAISAGGAAVKQQPQQPILWSPWPNPYMYPGYGQAPYFAWGQYAPPPPPQPQPRQPAADSDAPTYTELEPPQRARRQPNGYAQQLAAASWPAFAPPPYHYPMPGHQILDSPYANPAAGVIGYAPSVAHRPPEMAHQQQPTHSIFQPQFCTPQPGGVSGHFVPPSSQQTDTNGHAFIRRAPTHCIEARHPYAAAASQESGGAKFAPTPCMTCGRAQFASYDEYRAHQVNHLNEAAAAWQQSAPRGVAPPPAALTSPAGPFVEFPDPDSPYEPITPEPPPTQPLVNKPQQPQHPPVAVADDEMSDTPPDLSSSEYRDEHCATRPPLKPVTEESLEPPTLSAATVEAEQPAAAAPAAAPVFSPLDDRLTSPESGPPAAPVFAPLDDRRLASPTLVADGWEGLDDMIDRLSRQDDDSPEMRPGLFESLSAQLGITCVDPPRPPAPRAVDPAQRPSCSAANGGANGTRLRHYFELADVDEATVAAVCDCLTDLEVVNTICQIETEASGLRRPPSPWRGPPRRGRPPFSNRGGRQRKVRLDSADSDEDYAPPAKASRGAFAGRLTRNSIGAHDVLLPRPLSYCVQDDEDDAAEPLPKRRGRPPGSGRARGRGRGGRGRGRGRGAAMGGCFGLGAAPAAPPPFPPAVPPLVGVPPLPPVDEDAFLPQCDAPNMCQAIAKSADVDSLTYGHRQPIVQLERLEELVGADAQKVWVV